MTRQPHSAAFIPASSLHLEGADLSVQRTDKLNWKQRNLLGFTDASSRRSIQAPGPPSYIHVHLIAPSSASLHNPLLSPRLLQASAYVRLTGQWLIRKQWRPFRGFQWDVCVFCVYFAAQFAKQESRARTSPCGLHGNSSLVKRWEELSPFIFWSEKVYSYESRVISVPVLTEPAAPPKSCFAIGSNCVARSAVRAAHKCGT